MMIHPNAGGKPYEWRTFVKLVCENPSNFIKMVK